MTVNKGVLLSFLSVSLTSLSYPILKAALSGENKVSPIEAALFEAIFTLVLCYLYGLIRRKPVGFFGNRILILIGTINTVGALCLYGSLNLLNPVTAGILGRNSIIFSVLLSVLVLHESLSRMQTFLILSGIAGSFLFVYADSTDFSNLLGVTLSVMYTFLFALSNMITKVRAKDIDSNTILFTGKLISVGAIFVLLVATEGLGWLNADPGSIGLVFISAFFTTFIGLILFFEGLKRINFSLASMIRATGPVFVVIYSWPFFPPRLDPINVVGGALVVASVFLLVSMEALGWWRRKPATQVGGPQSG